MRLVVTRILYRSDIATYTPLLLSAVLSYIDCAAFGASFGAKEIVFTKWKSMIEVLLNFQTL